MIEILDRDPVAQRAVRSGLVVVPSPDFDLLLRVGQVRKPIRIEALVSELAVEALDLTVLGQIQDLGVWMLVPTLGVVFTTR